MGVRISSVSMSEKLKKERECRVTFRDYQIQIVFCSHGLAVSILGIAHCRSPIAPLPNMVKVAPGC